MKEGETKERKEGRGGKKKGRERKKMENYRNLWVYDTQT